MMMLQHLPSSVVYHHQPHDQVERHYHSRSSSPTSTPTTVEAPSVIIKRTYSTEDLATLREQRRSREEMFEGHRRWYVVKDEQHPRAPSSRPVEYEESDYESPDRERRSYHAAQYECKEEVYEITEEKEAADVEGPLDLSMNKYKSKRHERDDSGTDSEDSSGGNGDDQAQGRAYKKSLMKRYCKFIWL